MTEKRVAVILGGTSPERDVSLATGESVLEHFPRDAFDPVRVEILADGRWLTENRDPVPPAEAGLLLADVDIAFLALHGRFGEDGTIQGFLETIGIPYTGSGVAASAIAMDKVRAREILRAHGLDMPRAAVIEDGSEEDFEDLPVVVKDPTGGSSLDLTIARDRDAYLRAVRSLLARPGGRALVEEYIPGEEVTVAVLGNASVGEELRALPPVLIRPLRSDWFDYETKYDPDAVDEICPAPIADEVTARVKDLALTAHRVLKCDGITRTDFIVPEDGKPKFLELNTLPGLTAASISPKAAMAAGIPFVGLIQMLLEMALRKG